MFLLAAFLVTGVVAISVNRAGIPILIGFGLMYPFGYLLAATMWFNDKTGINSLIINSWQFLSGSDVPGQQADTCQQVVDPLKSLLLWAIVTLVLLMVCVVMAISGLIAIVGIPLGVIVSFFGGLATVFTRKPGALSFGAAALTTALACMIVSGLTMRLLVVVEGWYAC